MTQKEQITVIIKKIQIMDEQFKYARILLDRLEDRIIALEESMNSPYREDKEVIFESDFDVNEESYDDDEGDDEE